MESVHKNEKPNEWQVKFSTKETFVSKASAV